MVYFFVGARQLRIKKVINNNIICAVDEDGSELIATGRGLGYQRRTGERVDESLVQKVYRMVDRGRQRRLRELKPNQCGNLILGERHALCVPIYAQTEKIAYLLLSCTQWHIPDMDVIAFEHASSLIAIELLKERALVDKEQKVREKLLEDVFMKRYADEQMLYRRGFSLGIDLKKPYAVFTIDPD